MNEFWTAENQASAGGKREKFAPVGKVVPGVHLQILDENENSQPVGMPGEVFNRSKFWYIGYAIVTIRTGVKQVYFFIFNMD